MKRPILITTALLMSGVLLTGCTAQAATSGQTSQQQEQAVASSDWDLAPDAVMAENADYTTVNEDEWDEADAVDVTLSGSTASTTSAGVTVDGSTVTVTEAGVYRLSGSLQGQIVVAAPDDALVVLILDGAEITNDAGAAIDVQTADDVAIHLAAGSSNSVSDASSYADDVTADSAIHSETDLTISGSGALQVAGNGNDGITSKDDLVILGGTITVRAADDALRGKDALVVEGGTLDLTGTAGDGMKSDGDEDDTEIDWTRGYIYVSGGSISIAAGDDGLQAFTDTVIAGGTVTAAVVDDGVKAEAIVSVGGGEVTVTESTEAMESANVGISGGTVDLTASDDGINASGNTELQALIAGTEAVEGNDMADTGERLEVAGGSVTVDAEGDGLDSNGSLTISGGDIVVYGPTSQGNGALDANGSIAITGGSVLALSAGGLEQSPGTDGQGWVTASGQLAAGQEAEIRDASGNTIATFTSRKAASSVTFSSADVTTGETYTLVSDGTELGSAVAGEGGQGGMMGGGPGQGGGQGGGTGGGTGGERPEAPAGGFDGSGAESGQTAQ